LAYRLDNRLSRSGWFEPLGKSRKVVSPPKPIQGYFSRNKRKLRPFKIRVGKARAIRNGYIEKRRYALDRPGEKRQIRRTRKLTPNQRKVMLKNLKKARRSRSKQARKRR